MAGTTDVADTARSAADSEPLGWLARLGLTARGVVYLVMGWLAILVATGSSAHVDQRGALIQVLSAPFGTALVLLMAAAFVAYAVWRFSEVAFGVPGDGKGALPRITSLVRGVVYLMLAFSAIQLLRGAKGTQANQQGHLAGTVMEQSGGRVLVGLVGAAILVVGLVMVREGWSGKFMRYFGALPPGTRRPIIWLGRIGTVARGLVFAVAGALVVMAAWTAEPGKAGGIDVALKTLLSQPFGPALVLALGIGLMVFGVYGLAEAVWRRVPGDAGAR